MVASAGLTIATIRNKVADTIGDLLSSTSVPVNAYGYPPDSPQLNALLVLPRVGDSGGYVDYHRSFGTSTGGTNTGALCEIALTVELRTGGGQIDASIAMDLLLSCANAESIVDILLADLTLGGAVESVQIGAASQPAWFADTDGSRTWLAASLPLTIVTRR